jgi:HSP20 family protein
MLTTYWDPFAPFRRTFRASDPWLGVLDALANDAHVAPQVPRLEFSEEADHFELRALVPGVRPDNLHIEFEDGALTIAIKRELAAPEGAKLLRRERGAYEFSRALRFSEAVSPEGIRAELAQGVLRVHVPKVAKPAPRKIDVTVS